MGEIEKWISLLECPETRSALEVTSEGLVSSGNGTVYPLIEGVPWLFKAPQAHRQQWQNRIRAQILEWEAAQTRLDHEIAEPGLLPTTRRRLEAVRAGHDVNLQSVREVLGAWNPRGEWPSDLSQALSDRVPATQVLRSYFDTIFRDWVWGRDEHKALSEALAALVPQSLGPTLLLGSGAGRLVGDTLKNHSPELLIAVDINPLLLLVARRMLAGQNLSLCEFPTAPIESDSAAKIRECRGEKIASGEILWLHADGMNPPIRAKTLGTVITPWFVDIIPQDLRDQAKRINRVLKNGGHWLNVGPLGFQHARLAKCYGRQEVLEILAESGFEVRREEVRRVPYLQSPDSGHWREESVWCFQALKVKEVKEPKSFQYLPSWLLDWNEPVPQTEAVTAALTNHRIYFEVLSAVDGTNSVHRIAQAMALHYSMDPKLALESLVNFLTGIYERSLKGS